MFSFRIDEAIELRTLEAQHAAELFALTDRNRRHLRQWLPWLDAVKSVADTRSFITSSTEQAADSNGFQAGIWFAGRLAGVVGYHKIDWFNRATGIGYWLDAAHQGRGLMTKACRVLVNHAFTELKLNRVVIACATGNTRSRAIPERLGFRLEGVMRQTEWLYDHFVDHAIYAMLASEWQDGSAELKIRLAVQPST